MTQRASAFLKLQVFDVRSYRVEDDMHSLPNEVRDAVQAALRLQSFYQRWIHEHFVVRDPWEILRQMQGHRVLVVELQVPGSPPKEQIVAASILWDYELPVLVGTAPQPMRFLEVGTQRCILNGFNIQQVLNSISLMNSLIHDPQGIYFGAVYASNDRTIDNIIRHMDYVPWENPHSTLTCMLNHRAGTARTGKRIRFFRANLESVFSAARCIEELARTSVRTRKQKSSVERSESSAAPELEELSLRCEGTLLAPLLHYSRRVLELKPTDLATLKDALENNSIGDDFLLWKHAGEKAEDAVLSCTFSSLWKRITAR
jgi:hypothetical protein